MVNLVVILTSKNLFYVPVAQLDRVHDYGSWGCRFNSCRAHQFWSRTSCISGSGGVSAGGGPAFGGHVGLA